MMKVEIRAGHVFLLTKGWFTWSTARKAKAPSTASSTISTPQAQIRRCFTVSSTWTTFSKNRASRSSILDKSVGSNFQRNYPMLSAYCPEVLIASINIDQKGKITDKDTKGVSYIHVIRPGQMQLHGKKMQFKPKFPSLAQIGQKFAPYDKAQRACESWGCRGSGS
jgi:hypothetical protein